MMVRQTESQSDAEAFAARIERPRHRRLYDYWRAKAPPGMLPGRQHIDAVEIPALLPRIILYDVDWQGEAPHFRFRLVGTDIVQRYGRDATGRRFEDVYEGEILEAQLAAFREATTAGLPRLSSQRLPVADKSFVIYHRLILPLATDGERIDGLIALMEFDDPRP